MPLDLPLPKRCSLSQAALWVAREQRPVPDEIFEAAPLSLNNDRIAPDGPLRPLLQALRSGAITARAILHFESVHRSADPDSEASHFSPPVNLPRSIWSWSGLDWNRSTIEDGTFFLEVFDINELELEADKAIWYATREKIGSHQRLSIYLISVGTEQLMFIFPGTSGNQPRSQSSESLPCYTPPYLAFMLQACQQLGLTADRRVTKQEVETWVRENWPRALGQPSNSKIEYMSTFLRHPEDEKGGYHRPMRKT